jgi:DNA gyrase inhibitor GyrI
MISDREKFLMIQWAKAKDVYPSLDLWLEVLIDDSGHTVEQELSYDADQHQLNLTEQD